VPDALRYFQAGLDPKKTHTLTLANPSDQMALSLSSITLYKLGDKVSISSASQIKSASDSASSSHTSTSASVTSSSVTSSSVTSSGSGASDTSSAADVGPRYVSQFKYHVELLSEVRTTLFSGTGGAKSVGTTRLYAVMSVACGLVFLSLA
jgi:hypothetical protein